MTTGKTLDADSIVSTLRATAEQHRITGVSLAVAQGDQLVEAATGFVNSAAGIEATPDSVFQIGSITKLFTATLIMQLIDDGLLQLDTPLSGALPELDLADSAITGAVTISHLLSHTSGIEGDHFLDTGPGDDCVERFVVSCSALPQIHQPGQLFSYCNTGFILLGRIIEKQRGAPWHQILHDRIIKPLELSAMGTEAGDAILHRAAVGHMDAQNDPDGSPFVIPRWSLPRSNGPAGATPFGRARDLVPFVQAHLGDGLAPNGNQMLSSQSTRAMTAQQVQLPQYAAATGWGLGWMLFDMDGGQLIGHNGATLGQTSCLRVEPESGLIMSLLTTGGGKRVAPFFREMTDQVFGEQCGITSPPPVDELPTVDLAGTDLDRYCGTYRRLALEFEVTTQEGHLVLRSRGLKSPWTEAPAEQSVLRPISARAFTVESSGPLASSPVLFEDFDEEGQPQFIGIGARLTPRAR